ncbi:GGDEF domain-containing protein [Agrobacterium vitis]|uniref:GGDEF domain-containing protein n=1 Tax=Agrobacterium vitis TaxID=373 RepID=UPI0015D9A7F3|nr:diguanylate cyclase [Agrobacterium vitis]MCF1453283.1 GGDEF domain-containing protein [Agrobacterium vitis]BCH54360.1 GGDEF domain-containing protein [Agrobacterium vitis]
MATVSLEAIDRQIARGFPALRFSPAVEAEFLQEYVANRVKLTPFWAVVGTLIYDAVFIGDATMMADVFDKLLIVRFGIFTPFAIISVLAVRRWRTALNYELLSLGIGTLSILLPMSVAIYSQSPYMFVYQNGNVAAFLFFVIALRPRFHIVVIGLTLMCGVLLKTAKLNGSFDDITYSGLISFYITIAIFLALSAYFLEHTDRLNFLNRLRAGLLQQQLEHNAARDELSGLLNRRSLVQVATDMWKGKTPATHVCAIMLDIDDFKLYNDVHGHLEGDECLRTVSQCIRDNAGEKGFAFRYGGEEMLVLLPNTDADAACAIAEAIRRAIECMNIPHLGKGRGQVTTASLGVAEGLTATVSLEDLLNRADAALYEAKRSGRNRVCVSGSTQLDLEFAREN